MVRRSLALLVVASIAASVTAGAAARSGECEAAGKVCLGTLPSSHSRVVLKSVNGSSEHGVAEITFGFHETKVVLRLRGAPAGAQAVHVLAGGCAGKVVKRLGAIVGGRGTRSAGPLRHVSGYAIAVRSSTAGSAIVACGVVTRR